MTGSDETGSVSIVTNGRHFLLVCLDDIQLLAVACIVLSERSISIGRDNGFIVVAPDRASDLGMINTCQLDHSMATYLSLKFDLQRSSLFLILVCHILSEVVNMEVCLLAHDLIGHGQEFLVSFSKSANSGNEPRTPRGWEV